MGYDQSNHYSRTIEASRIHHTTENTKRILAPVSIVAAGFDGGFLISGQSAGFGASHNV
jgi:hypothetical protein